MNCPTCQTQCRWIRCCLCDGTGQEDGHPYSVCHGAGRFAWCPTCRKTMDVEGSNPRSSSTAGLRTIKGGAVTIYLQGRSRRGTAQGMPVPEESRGGRHNLRGPGKVSESGSPSLLFGHLEFNPVKCRKQSCAGASRMKGDDHKMGTPFKGLEEAPLKDWFDQDPLHDQPLSTPCECRSAGRSIKGLSSPSTERKIDPSIPAKERPPGWRGSTPGRLPGKDQDEKPHFLPRRQKPPRQHHCSKDPAGSSMLR